VAKAVEKYVRDARRWKQWHDDELGTVAYWLDQTLERYRLVVARDVLNGTNERATAPQWFTGENATLKKLRESVLDARYRPTGEAASTNDHKSANPRGGKDKRIPDEVKAIIPKRGDKELCVKHLSNKGCNKRADGKCFRPMCVHERPRAVPKLLGDFVNKNLGGLHPSVKIE
jgi:hypothetical protein